MSTTESTLRRVARALELRLDELVDDMLDRMRVEIPGFVDFARPELAVVSRRSCYANLRAGLDGLLNDRNPPAAPPAEAEVEARQAARLGASLPALLQTYRVGHAVVFEHLLTEVDALELEAGPKRSVVRLASRYLFHYVDQVIPGVTEAYTRERDRLLRGSEQRRARLVHDILSGADVDGGELGYDPRGTHLGVLGWGDHAEDALRILAGRLDRGLLLVSHALEVTWAWIAASGLSPKDWQAIARFNPGANTRLAFGAVEPGIEGFRRTHRQAQRAYLVARRTQAPITCYHDVAVEAWALADEPASREFVARELGPLLGDDERGRRLRSTLRAYLAASGNASAAAGMLGVNDRTVAYRLRGIEELLGYPVASRALELHLALRLAALFEERSPSN